MRLPYEELIFPGNYVNKYKWTIKKPLLREIYELKLNVFLFYETILNMEIDYFINAFGSDELRKFWDSINPEEKGETDFYDLVLIFEPLQGLLRECFNFFSPYKVIVKDGEFLQIGEDESDVKAHISTKDEFNELRENLLSVCNIAPKKEEEPEFSANADVEMAKHIWEKLKAAREKNEKEKKVDLNYTLPNIISAVAVYSNSYNFINIWDITICQLYIVFERIQYNIGFDMNKTHVSVWGDEDRKFDGSQWFKSLEQNK